MCKRNLWLLALPVGALALALTTTAASQELDVTMEVVDEDATEERMVNRLELPRHASDQGRESSSFGRDTANQAREQGREFGQDQAREASERAAEARARRESARDAARNGSANASSNGAGSSR